MTRMDSDGNGSLSQEEFVQGVLKVTEGPEGPEVDFRLVLGPSFSIVQVGWFEG